MRKAESEEEKIKLPSTIGAAKAGMPTIVGLKVYAKTNLNEISNKILSIDGAEKVFTTLGDFDIVAIVHAVTSAELNEILKDIRAVDGVHSTQSFLVLQEFEKNK